MWQMIPRAVGFKNGIAVCAGNAVHVNDLDSVEVIELPTDHYDFLGPVTVQGKTYEQIVQEALTWSKPT
jgi:hypothetical protein